MSSTDLTIDFDTTKTKTHRRCVHWHTDESSFCRQWRYYGTYAIGWKQFKGSISESCASLTSKIENIEKIDFGDGLSVVKEKVNTLYHKID